MARQVESLFPELGPNLEPTDKHDSMQISNVPADVNVTIINDLGKLIFQDKSGLSSRKLEINKRLPGERHFILFTDEKDNPYKENLRLSIDVKNR